VTSALSTLIDHTISNIIAHHRTIMTQDYPGSIMRPEGVVRIYNNRLYIRRYEHNILKSLKSLTVTPVCLHQLLSAPLMRNPIRSDRVEPVILSLFCSKFFLNLEKQFSSTLGSLFPLHGSLDTSLNS